MDHLGENEMANLLDLAGLTGNKSPTEMTEEELRDKLRLIRQNRRTTKTSDLKLTEKKRTSKSKDALDLLLESLSPEQIKELLAKEGL
jgi:hypothetical protein